MEDYIAANSVILNPLHFQGYTTIGCNRCTTPVLPGEPNARGAGGIWAPGLPIAGSIRPISPAQDSVAIEVSQDLADRILGRRTDFVI